MYKNGLISKIRLILNFHDVTTRLRNIYNAYIDKYVTK